MTEEAAAVQVLAPARAVRQRVRQGLRRPSSWLQLIRFAVVGASGYVVNLAVFTLAVHGAALAYPVAATLAFLVAVSNNFFWHRRWTFRAHGGRARNQAGRFLVVSVSAFIAGLLMLTALIELLGMPEVPAQACAIVAVTPLSFVVNKLWTFGR